MSTGSQSEARDVGESKQEVLRGLLNSLIPDSDMALPKDADLSELAEKLDEILASKGGLTGVQADIPRDEQGRPLNEEGLPIMDIIEPVEDDLVVGGGPSSRILSPSSVSEQAPLSPLPNWALSPTALAARRRERDRILDMLEREEDQEFAREAAVAAGNKAPAPQVAYNPPQTLDQIVPSPAGRRGPSPSTRPAQPTAGFVPPADNINPISRLSTTPEAETSGAEPTRKPKKQKSVSFADPPPLEHSNDCPRATDPVIDWGDVVPVPLDLRKARQSGSNPVKELVVERKPGQASPSSRIVDSDDSDEDNSEDENNISHGEESDIEVPAEALRPSGILDDEHDELEDDPTVGADETDFDEAMLQREIALAYYARRNQIGTDVVSGPLSDSTAMNQLSDRIEVKSDMDEKSNATHFRRSRLAGDPQALINSAVQYGKLVEGQLVAEVTADDEAGVSPNELPGEIGGKGENDMTKKTLALLMRSGDISSDEPSISLPLGEHVQTSVTGSASASARSGNTIPPHRRTAPETHSTPKPRVAPGTPPAKVTKPVRTTNSTPSQLPPMIIESGFGFDPAFQVAPKLNIAAAKPVATMAETVKERSGSSVTQSLDRGRGKSRFALASETERVNPRASSTTPNTERSSAPGSGDVAERATSSRWQPPEPNKRISRFRAERAGYL